MRSEQVGDDVQPRPLLVVGVGDPPRRPCGVGGGEHVVACLRVLGPALVGQQVHLGQLPDLPGVVDPALEAAGLFVGADLQPVLEEQDARVDHRLLDPRRQIKEAPGLLGGAESHHPFDAGPVVPAPVEDDHLAGRREVRQVPLDVHLGLLALGRRRQRDHPEHPGADPLGDRLDGAALAGGVAALEHDADLGPGVLDPLLDGDQLAVQAPQLVLVLLALHLRDADDVVGDSSVGARGVSAGGGCPVRPVSTTFHVPAVVLVLAHQLVSVRFGADAHMGHR